MNYDESIAYIESLVPTLERPTLTRMKLFMSEAGAEQRQIKCFHVGGTNGKGSVTSILEALLSASGQKVGKFTGPHIMRFNERFSISGKTIADEDFARVATAVRDESDRFAGRHPDLGGLTWFEFLTAMAFSYFSEMQVDCAVLEVGLGGRFDATNVAENIEASIITNVDFDHMHILGNTIAEIAFEKAGIMRAGVPVFTYAKAEALDVIKSRAAEIGTRVIDLSSENPQDILSSDDQAKLESAVDHLTLKGPHQKKNARLALYALAYARKGKELNDCLSAIEETFSKIYFPGRMQFLPNKNLIMDGAHNPAGAHALRLALDEHFQAEDSQMSATNFCFILGFFGNKDVLQYLKELLREGDQVIAMEASVRRITYPKEAINARCRELGIEARTATSIEDALKQAQSVLSPHPTIVTGSFAILKELMLFLGWQSVDDRKSLELTA